MRDDLGAAKGVFRLGVVMAVIYVVILGAALGGCAGQAPPVRVETQTVNMPVARSCVPSDMPDAPEYVDTDAALRAAAAPEDRYQLLAAGRSQRIARLRVVEPVLSACK